MTDPDEDLVDDDPLEPAQVRRAQVVDMHRRGLTFEAIGQQMGFSRQRAHEIYWKAMNSVQAQAVNAYRAQMVEELAEIVRVANQVLHTDHFAHSNGRIVELEGQPIIDDGPKLDAARTIIAAQARLSKVLGSDEPTRVESNATVTTYQVELGDGAKEAMT